MCTRTKPNVFCSKEEMRHHLRGLVEETTAGGLSEATGFVSLDRIRSITSMTIWLIRSLKLLSPVG